VATGSSTSRLGSRFSASGGGLRRLGLPRTEGLGVPGSPDKEA
jgi:hypothetical protein